MVNRIANSDDDESPSIRDYKLPDDVKHEIADKLAAIYPGYTVKFASDMPDDELPRELLDEIAEYDAKVRQSLVDGRCIDCGVQMPNWPPTDGWVPEKNWRCFTSVDDNDVKRIACWQCPACDIKDGDPDCSRN